MGTLHRRSGLPCFAALALAAAALLAPATARAVPLGFEATLTVEMPFLVKGRLLPTLSASASGTAMVSAGGAFSLPAGVLFASTDFDPGLFAGVTNVSRVQASFANGTGSFAPGHVPPGLAPQLSLAGGGLGGTMPLSGSLLQEILGGLVSVVAPLSVVGAGGIAIGVDGLFTTPVLSGTAWTTGVARVFMVQSQVTTLDVYGFPNQVVPLDATRTGFDARTTGGLGTLQLVSPMRIVGQELPGFATLTVTFVPEPRSALLLGAAAAALLLEAKRRRR